MDNWLGFLIGYILHKEYGARQQQEREEEEQDEEVLDTVSPSWRKHMIENTLKVWRKHPDAWELYRHNRNFVVSVESRLWTPEFPISEEEWQRKWSWDREYFAIMSKYMAEEGLDGWEMFMWKHGY
jgi:hypothetical protein